MGKAQPLKDIGKFAESLVRDTVGSLTGIAQADQASRERQAAFAKKQGTAVYQKFDPKDIEAFSRMSGQLTEKTASELAEAKPVSYTETKDVRTKGFMQKSGQAREKLRKDVEQEYASMTASQRERIEGLYKAGQARLGAIERGRLRPGRKQTVLTKRM
jgi:hypothetical protein